MPVSHSPRSSCGRNRTKKTAQKTKKKPEADKHLVIRFGIKDNYEHIGRPVANERAASRRAEGKHRSDEKHTLGVVTKGVCVEAYGPDAAAVVGKPI